MTQVNPAMPQHPQFQRQATARQLAKGLYAITDGPRGDLLASARAALQGGAAMLQYRDKTGDAERRLCEVHALAGLCGEFGVPLIINDDIELARAGGATGVHLGEHDSGIAEARAMLGGAAIIGVSCYDSLQTARDAALAGADYLAFGAFFPSVTKPGARRAKPVLLRDARELGLPLVAIGGITPENGGSLIAAGADFLAVVSAVFGARDIRAAARRFAALFETRDQA
ncbi:MAG TPA: thiamine phosphate synthase [Rhodanobacteraceae bacterium]|nr:thiamine phosphate synthase [Rhodanobacteraceae bacterium]